MEKLFLTAAVALLGISLAHAQDDVLIELDTGRTQGLFTKTPVVQRAILTKPARPAETALLFFRGGSSNSAQIRSVTDKQRNLLTFMRMNQHLFLEEGIALVIIACPTDQWEAPGRPPNTNSCYDRYRSSKEHAEDVRRLIAKLKDEHGIRNIFLMGHSAGTVSSRWLARNLGNEIAGSIHSGSVNQTNPNSYSGSLSGFRYDAITTPMLHVHHEGDACATAPYSTVKEYAGENLVTVRGGVAAGDPCFAGHLHSYQGREELVVKSIVSWIRTRKVDRLIGE